MRTTSMIQTRLPSEWISGTEEESSSDYSSEEEVKRGRKFQPLYWTRVKSLEMINKQRIMVY